jgi:hypothetical protein
MDTSSQVPDMILGVAFLRNVYTVMAYDSPNAQGVFPTNNDANNNQINPCLGLLGITNATRAMQEFNNVHVLNLPLNGSSPTSTQGASSDKVVSVGIVVLFSLLGLIIACAMLFGLRWFLMRRQIRRGGGGLHLGATDLKLGDGLGAYQLAPHTPISSVDMGNTLGMSTAGNSARTVIGQDEIDSEFGFLRKKVNGLDGDTVREVSFLNLDPADPDGWRDTLVGSTIDLSKPSPQSAVFDFDQPMSSTQEAALAAATAARLPLHRHTGSEMSLVSDGFGIVEPLLTHARGDSTGTAAITTTAAGDFDTDADLGIIGHESMAGIGTAGRSPRIRARHGDNAGSVVSLGQISLASVAAAGGRFPSIAPGERLSGLSMLEGYKDLPPAPAP